MAAHDLLGAQFVRMAPNLGHRGSSRSLPWVMATMPTRTFKATASFKTPKVGRLGTNISRATRGRKTGSGVL